MDITLLLIIIAVVALVSIAAAFGIVAAREAAKRRELREGFGPEYHHTLARSGDRSAAQKELLEGRKRVAEFDLKPIPSVDAAPYAQDWRRAQERFVDDPGAAIRGADRLVQEVMHARGYPRPISSSAPRHLCGPS